MNRTNTKMCLELCAYRVFVKYRSVFIGYDFFFIYFPIVVTSAGWTLLQVIVHVHICICAYIYQKLEKRDNWPVPGINDFIEQVSIFTFLYFSNSRGITALPKLSCFKLVHSHQNTYILLQTKNRKSCSESMSFKQYPAATNCNSLLSKLFNTAITPPILA